jgi:hypothetical protein
MLCCHVIETGLRIGWIRIPPSTSIASPKKLSDVTMGLIEVDELK